MRHLLGLAVLVLGLCAGASVQAEDCPELPGVAQLFANPETRVIWVGEMHGTSEMPALFGDIVCAAGSRGRPVYVVLERLDSEFPLWNMYLTSDGSDQARGLLWLGEQWQQRQQDGRSSVAMTGLAERLRLFRAGGYVLALGLMDGVLQLGDNRDAHMALVVGSLRDAHPDALILVYSGNFHAMKAETGDLHAAAGYLPAETTVTVNIRGGGSDHARGIVMGEGAPRFDATAYTGLPTTPSPPALAEALAVTLPVVEAFTKVDAAQAALPTPASDRERLERLFDRDQAGRALMDKIDFAALPVSQQGPAFAMAGAEINRHDVENQAVLKALMPKNGWFLKSQYGQTATDAAFLVAQHATNDPDLMRDVLRRMEPLIGSGEINDGNYALLYDRVALDIDKKPQRYGTQVGCEAGKWRPEPLEDPDHVDDRRKTVGLVPESEYLAYFGSQPCHFP